MDGIVVLDTSGLAPAHEANGPRTPGAPDIIVLRDGVAVAVEVKSRSGQLTPRQVAWGEKWEANGGRYRCCRTLHEVMDAVAP
ncbi:MAG: hypothetical protein F4Z29_00515 [Gemmatimonadetes bacterium]|nr:hypothetical protein [Gemmatimonadota bacterium]